ncbi:MAG: bifunctional 5,10-methylenetetrahydrofolate dehydrogenase/5,10-methenyltetrahydrofolate cyclohydrolase [Candidatus Micrarchaeia archaeon]
MHCVILDGSSLAKKVIESVSKEAAGLEPKPHLVVIQVGDNEASTVYVRRKADDCEKAGLKSTVIKMPAKTTQKELLDKIASLNADKGVHGILVQLPLPKHIDEDAVITAVLPEKDVDGFHPLNAGRLLQGDSSGLVSCTPKGVIRMLEHYGIPIAGAHAVVVGRSNIVGKPLAQLLLNKDATVTIAHSKTKNLEEITRQADILAVGVGKPRFIKAGMVKDGATVIDIGINRTDGKLIGDSDFDALCGKVRAISPVPGGVGPMTRAMLLENLMLAYRMQQASAKKKGK